MVPSQGSDSTYPHCPVFRDHLSDHLLDYYLRWIKKERRFLILFFHGWEYLFVASLLYLLMIQETWLLAACLGYLTQIGADQLFNKPRWSTYLIIFRASRGFKTTGDIDNPEGLNPDNSFVASLPFGRRQARSWFESRK